MPEDASGVNTPSRAESTISSALSQATIRAPARELQKKASHWELVFDQTHVTPEVLNWPYEGSGTEQDPYVVEYIENDRRNPMLFPRWKKWMLTFLVSVATLAVALLSSSYTGGIEEILQTFHVSRELATLGLSLFVLGFAIGPLLWAPLSELYGRQVLFFSTYAVLTAFNAGAAGSQSIQTLIVLRFFAGAFGSSPLTNAGGIITDMFPASERGFAMGVFAAAPFVGPMGGGFMAIFPGSLWIIGALTIPETYTPVILRRRAKKLSDMTAKVYKTKIDLDQGEKSLGHEFKTALSRPWILLFKEPIVLLLSIYMATVYGTLYMMFGAFPIVYQEQQGWSAGIGGLSFMGVAVGMIFAIIFSIFDNKRYMRVAARHNGNAPPEARLLPSLIGSISLPIGLFWFAWTSYPSIHWSVSIIGTAPFGFGMVLVFLSTMNYLIDAYVLYAASVLAANSVLRSLFGAVFPLFTTYMYQNLGIHWASSIPAFLALACMPFPFLFYKYGMRIRLKCKYAAETAKTLEQSRSRSQQIREAHSEMWLEQADNSEERAKLDTSMCIEGDLEKDLESGESGISGQKSE